MDLSLTETQQMLKQAVADFVSRDAPISTLIEIQQTERGFSDEMWSTAGELGWLGMLIPEQYGGSATELTDAAVLFEALGKGAVPGPFVSSALAAELINTLGSDEQKQDYLPRIATGAIICTLAMTEADYQWGSAGVRMSPQEDGGDFVLNGEKLFVFDGHAADYIITAVRTGDNDDDISLLIVSATAAGVATRPLDGFTSSEAAVTYENVRVSRSALLGEINGVTDGLNRTLTRITPLLCAYQVGGAQAVFEMSVQYSRDRVQFGRPIGRFQFVQNHIVQLVNHLDSARWTTYEALWKLDEGQDAQAAVHLAKAVTSDGYRQACDYAHEVHAGTGVMREYGLTLYTRLSRSLSHALGDSHYHRRQLGKIIPTMEIPEE
jgi:acyl-CoA dehydrogenase